MNPFLSYLYTMHRLGSGVCVVYNHIFLNHTIFYQMFQEWMSDFVQFRSEIAMLVLGEVNFPARFESFWWIPFVDYLHTSDILSRSRLHVEFYVRSQKNFLKYEEALYAPLYYRFRNRLPTEFVVNLYRNFPQDERFIARDMFAISIGQMRRVESIFLRLLSKYDEAVKPENCDETDMILKSPYMDVSLFNEVSSFLFVRTPLP